MTLDHFVGADQDETAGARRLDMEVIPRLEPRLPEGLDG